MNTARALLTCGLMAAVGVAAVLLRQDLARQSYRIQRLHREQVELEKQLWASQIDVARLRVPAETRGRVDSMGLGVLPPQRRPTAGRAQEARSREIIRTHD